MGYGWTWVMYDTLTFKQKSTSPGITAPWLDLDSLSNKKYQLGLVNALTLNHNTAPRPTLFAPDFQLLAFQHKIE